jgi:predicted MPP superfamily phosphohydrolase
MPLTRRQLLRCSPGALLAANVWPGVLAARDRHSASFQFAVVNDLHYYDKNCEPWFTKLIASLHATPGGIDFLLIAGDLVEKGNRTAHAAIAEILKTLKAPWYTVVGNHDYETQTDRKAYEAQHPGRFNYHFTHNDWQFVCLDTSEGLKGQGVTAPPETFTWLDTTLPKLDKQKPLVVLTHFPLLFMAPLILKNGKAVLERFKEYALQAVYSGHYHGYTELKSNQTVLTTGKCCSFHRDNHDKTPQKGYFLCGVVDGRIKRSFVQLN